MPGIEKYSRNFETFRGARNLSYKTVPIVEIHSPIFDLVYVDIEKKKSRKKCELSRRFMENE